MSDHAVYLSTLESVSQRCRSCQVADQRAGDGLYSHVVGSFLAASPTPDLPIISSWVDAILEILLIFQGPHCPFKDWLYIVISFPKYDKSSSWKRHGHRHE